MYEISKLHTFSASHQLSGLDPDHPCGRVHGHNYRLRITVASLRVDRHGFVMDYHQLAPFTRWVDENLDHRHLNDLAGFQPSAELLSRWLTEKARELLTLPDDAVVSVAVSETDKTWATWIG